MTWMLWTVRILLGLDAVLFLMMLYDASLERSDAAGNGMSWAFTVIVGLVLGGAAFVFFVSDHPIALGISGFMAALPLLYLGYQLLDRWNVFGTPPDSIQQFPPAYFQDPRYLAVAEAIVRGDGNHIASLSKGIDLNAKGSNEANLLQFAIHVANTFHDETRVYGPIRALLEAGADPNLAMSEAVTALSPTTLRLFLDAGADANGVGYHDQPLVIMALQNVYPDNLRLLVERGADVRHTTDRGYSLPMVLAQREQWKLIPYLVEKGVDLAYQAPDGNTVLKLMQKFETDLQQAQVALPAEYVAFKEWVQARNVPTTAP